MLELALAAIAQAALPTVAFGVVIDAETNRPLAGALVQQEGSVSSVFTQPDGAFRFLLDRSGRPTLRVSAVGYDAVTLPIGDGRALRVALPPIRNFVPVIPTLPMLAPGTGLADRAPLHSHLAFGYRVRHQALMANGAAIAGWANNDVLFGARFRYRPWLLEGELNHFQTPIDVTGLSPAENPAYVPGVWQVGVRGGWLTAFSAELEGALALGYRFHSWVPNNQNIRYTGSAFDFEQTRHAFGPVGTLAWRPGRGPWHLETSLGLYPLVLASARDTGTPVGGAFYGEGRAGVSYEVVSGLRLGLDYTYQDWRGNGSDASQLIGVRAHYTPGGVPQGNEQ